jgi:ribosomal protein S6--L-glutamate ligase
MKILVIGSSKSKESQLLKQEAEKRNHSVEIIPLSKLIFNGRKSLSIITSAGLDIKNFEAVLFRAISQHIIEAKIVAQYMKDKKRKVIDEILAQGNYEYHKFFMHSRLWAQNIPQPLTFFVLNLDGVKTAIQKLKPPIIVKHIKEMHGRSNFRFDSKKQVFDFFKKKNCLGNYLIQEWYPAKYYYRTLVLGNKVLGVMKRLSIHCQDRPDIPLSQRSKKAVLSPALEKISLQTTQALGIELAGLDIMPDSKGQLRVLEINRSPQFKRFTQVTGLNVAEEIIKYIEEKSS